MNTKPTIYTTGGTVQAGNGIYLTRKADDELFELCQNGQFSYVLTSRQMGKSSLMVETAKRLKEENIITVIIDLTKIGTTVTAEQWYLGLLTEIDESLMLDIDIFEWWNKNSHLGITQRLTRFFEEVILEEIKEHIVIFVDEIDTTLSLEFTDDFFIAIRYFYTARAQNERLKYITFVLLGVASPNELIQDRKRTPFNIGVQVDLTDFSKEELSPLVKGLNLKSDNHTHVIDGIVFWTNGHPYLTQYLFKELSEKSESSSLQEELSGIVVKSILAGKERQDSNLSFVRDMLIKRCPDRWATLTEYKKVLNSANVDDEKSSIVKNHLKLSGLVANRNGKLQIRNRIYQKAFDNEWVNKQLSDIRPSMRTVVGSSFLTAVVLIVMKSLGIFMPLELWVYDWIVAYHHDLGPDPRILLVGINEQDLNNQKSDSPSDQSIADAIEIIQSHNPTTIGLDLHRNFPVGDGRAALARSLAANNIIGITKLGDFEGESIPPPPALDPIQVGFNDFVLDPDGKIRRNLLFASGSTDADAEVYTSFGLIVALHYLEKQHGLKPSEGDEDNEFMGIGKARFKLMDRNFGGYQAVDAAGYQVPIIYRSPNNPAKRVSLTDILTNTVDPRLISNKVILIGTTAYTSNDKFFTPYTIRGDNHQMSGVEIHLHMVSQFLSAVLNESPLVSSLSEVHETLYLVILTMAGGLLTRRMFFRKVYVLSVIFIGVLSIVFIAHVLYWAVWAYWIPFVSPALGIFMVNITVAAWMRVASFGKGEVK